MLISDRLYKRRTCARLHMHAPTPKGNPRLGGKNQQSGDGRAATTNTKAFSQVKTQCFVLNRCIIDPSPINNGWASPQRHRGTNTTKTGHVEEGRNRPAASPSHGLFGGLARCFIIDRSRSIIETWGSSRGGCESLKYKRRVQSKAAMLLLRPSVQWLEKGRIFYLLKCFW